MAHALDFDDTYDEIALHATAPVIPTSLAMAEQKGVINGKDLITAIVLGIDLSCRMAKAAAKFAPAISGGWHTTAIYGVFSSAATTGKILELDEDRMLNALGIAYSQAAGNGQCVPDGALTKRLQPGLAARAGVLSGLLAQRGFTGAKNIIQGKWGFYNTYEHHEYDPEELTIDLGKIFRIVDLSIKPYPCCRHTHAAIDATLEMVQEFDIASKSIDIITVGVTKQAYEILCDPLETKRNPRVVVDAQFSIPYTVATALVKKKVFIEDFTEESLRDPEILEIARKVNPMIYPEIERGWSREISPAKVEIKTKNGKTYSKQVNIPRGSCKKPMTMKEVAEKFRGCAAHAIKLLPGENIEEVIKIVDNLEDVSDVTDIVRLLV